MSDLNSGSSAPLLPPVRQASSLDATPIMESPSYRIQRWIGGQDPYPTGFKPRDSEEALARRQHDQFAEVDWELEEFEREMALRFVMRDLQLDLEDRRGRSTPAARLRAGGRGEHDSDATMTRTQRLRTQSSTTTLQPLARRPPSLQLPPSVSPLQFAYPFSSCASSTPPSTTPATPDPPPHTPPSDTLARFLRSSASTHRASPSVLSLSSHFSCTSSASTSVETQPEAAACPAASSRSVVSQFGQKLKHGFASSSPAVSPRSPYRPKPPGTPVVTEIPPPGGTAKRRRVSVPVALGPKKRRLVVRGIEMDDDYAVEGVRRWASSLGEVSRMCRTPDGTIWIEFRDRRVAENVCCLQAQVVIPRVGRVVLDWAEGRQPG